MTTVRRITGDALANIRANVRLLMQDRHLTIRGLEKLAGVERSQVYDLVNVSGRFKASISADVLDQIAVALNVTPENLMRAHSNQGPPLIAPKPRGAPFVGLGPLHEVVALLRMFDAVERRGFVEIEGEKGPVGRPALIIDPALQIDPTPYARAFFDRQRLRMTVKTAVGEDSAETLYVLDARPME